MIRFYLVIFTTLLLGFLSGWFINHEVLWASYQGPPSWYKPTDEERLVSAINLSLGCDGKPADDINNEFMSRLLFKSIRLGLIKENTTKEYHINKQALLNHVTDFGWKTTGEYSEFFYYTPQKYTFIANQFKQVTNKSGVTEIVIATEMKSDGWNPSESIVISKQSKGTRVACREYK